MKKTIIAIDDGDKVSYLEVIRNYFKGRLGCSSVEPLNLIEDHIK